MQKAVEDQPGRLELGGVAVSGLDLAEDLRLAEDHRIQARCDPEQMPDGILALVIIQVLVDFVRRYLVVLGNEPPQRRDGRLRLLGCGTQLDPVAGRDDQAFGNRGQLEHFMQWPLHGGRCECEAFTNFNRCCFVAQPDDDDMHGALLKSLRYCPVKLRKLCSPERNRLTPKKVKRRKPKPIMAKIAARRPRQPTVSLPCSKAA